MMIVSTNYKLTKTLKISLMIGLQITHGSIKDLSEALVSQKIPTNYDSYLLQNIGVKITNNVKISSLPSNIAKAKTPLLVALIFA